ncbi:MAG: hypothetical protein WAM60_19270 [Candidatus Promineifilaceae bacterium]
MGVGWIDNIFVNTDSSWFLKSIDTEHNGALSGGGSSFKLDDGNYHQLNANTRYSADWCGIPWYGSGKRFKVFSKNQVDGVVFYTSENWGKNWIKYEGVNTGRPIARQSAPKGSDFHCNMRFENDGVFIDIVNNNAFSGENAVYSIYNQAKQWVEALGPIIAAAISAGAGAGG